MRLVGPGDWDDDTADCMHGEDGSPASGRSADVSDPYEVLDWHANELEQVRKDAMWGEFDAGRAARALIDARAFLTEYRHEFEGPYALLTFDELVDEVQDLVDAVVRDIGATEVAHDEIEAISIRHTRHRDVCRERWRYHNKSGLRGHRAGFKPYRRAQL